MTPDARRQIVQTIATLRALLDTDEEGAALERVTVGELWTRYLATLPAKEAEHWVRSMISMTKPILARIGEFAASSITVQHWEDYRDDPAIRARFCSTSRNLHLKRMSTFFGWAVRTGRMAANPWKDVKRERGAPKRETEVSADGEAAVLERFDPAMQAFIIVAVDTAMRRDEIRLLEWTDIDMASGIVTIPAARTKTKRARVGRLTSRALEALQAVPKVPGSPFVFCNPETKLPWHQATITSRWRRAADEAKLQPAAGDKSVRLHDLRGTAISRLHRLGAPIGAIQKIAGHASLTTTAGYIRVNSKDIEAAHELLEQATRKGPHRSPATLTNQIVAGAAGDSRGAS